MRVVTALGFNAVWRFRKLPIVAATALAILVLGLVTPSRADAPEGCTADLPAGETIGAAPKDLKIDHTCYVRGATYTFSHVNIVDGGKLIFVEPTGETGAKQQDFWATSIIIEKGGAIYAGVDVPGDKEMVNVEPYGKHGRTLTFHLYGADPRGEDPKAPEGPGVSCAPIAPEDVNATADCGIPLKKTAGGQEVNFWTDNGQHVFDLPGGVRDYFYQYGSLAGDDGVDLVTKQKGHFGYKVLALSYGGTLQLRGLNGTGGTLRDLNGTSGAKTDVIKTLLKDPDELAKEDSATITDSGTDWVRLVTVAGTQLTLDRKVDWHKGSEIVVTSTDYFPEHSEVRTLAADAQGTNVVTLDAALEHPHNATQYNIGAKVGTGATAFREAVAKADNVKNSDPVPFLDKAETRAAVALLTRDIRIVSEGDKPGETFKDATKGDATKQPPIKANANYMYGGQVVFRQGFEKLQIQGVEFKQLGQGGLLGRYPVHFHMARKVPADTYVIDSSVNESMTRWFVVHSTLGLTLARNVGYKSIGHGYFLEDATETDDKLYSNIGIYARASIAGGDNDRNIPGLLDAPNRPKFLALKYHSDSQYPSVFWLTNGWNTVAGNMAAGTGTCGACYWYVPAGNHDMVEVGPDNTAMKWSGYSQIQADPNGPLYNGRAGKSPIRAFYQNYCSSAMHSLSITDGSPCTQVEEGYVKAVTNVRAPAEPELPNGDEAESMMSRMYFPRYTGTREPAYCDPKAADGSATSCKVTNCIYANPLYCMPSVFLHYTSSFNWAQTNFSAIWLRKGYLLLDHAFLSDVQGPGVTLITGGDYTRSNLPVGYWGLTSNSIFVGTTQPANKYALEKGPECKDWRGNICLDSASGAGFPLAAFGTEQRLYNVYDGPAYEDANAFLDIYASKCNSRPDCMYWETLGVRKAYSKLTVPVGPEGDRQIAKGDGYLPNAAIGWKQSNGFYYPPAFHSRNLLFKDVDIRHYVVEPLTYHGTYRTDLALTKEQYAGIGSNTRVFANWSDVDRQTELNDDDGTLTGFNNTISVNEDPFFRAPVQTAQCRSNVGVDASNACAGSKPPPELPTARTSPYDHITTAIYPAYAPDDTWAMECSNELCTGVPIYRQYLTGIHDGAKSTREWASWVANKCDEQFANLKGKIRKALPYDPYDPLAAPNRMLPILDPTTAAFQYFDKTCPAPFVRMAGMSLGQRSVLTVNNGKYFIDTTVSDEFQRTTPDIDPGRGRFVSVFQPNKSYYVFFVFAKKTTHQTYQIYVGKGFDPKSITGVRVDITSLNQKSFSNWKDYPWTAHLDEANPNVVDVDVDFRKVKEGPDTNLDPKKLDSDLTYMDDTCQPHTYCTKQSTGGKTTCGCDTKKLGVLGLLSPNYLHVCENVCSHWAVEDIDCPKGGCLGFKFTMPDGFKAGGQFERPKPTEYPADPWNAIKFVTTTKPPDNAANVGGCHYSDKQVPSDKLDSTCKVRD